MSLSFLSHHNPPSTHHTSSFTLDIEALSGLAGSISIACWVVVFSPQIIENFRNKSADGLSVAFIIIWLLGDIFNILGAVLQGVLPTMTILAIYYTLADIVLLGQLFYYRGFTLSDAIKETDQAVEADGTDERTALLDSSSTTTTSSIKQRPSLVRTLLLNLAAIVAVIACGILGWYLTTGNRIHTPSTQLPGGHRSRHETPDQHNSELQFHLLGQIFGYICMALYLGSRIPQLLLNYRRKSTEGLSLLFFTFAILGNLTYVASILLYEPYCEGKRNGNCGKDDARALYWRYFLINLSWFVGSFGTLWLDGFVFVQYLWYNRGGKRVGDV